MSSKRVHQPVAPYQTVSDRSPVRNDHVWARNADNWKCCICGAVTKLPPPPYPTPDDWTPDGYELLSEAERALAPKTGNVVRR